MALLSRLHWWTVEYGLIGPLEKPKIYGAGLAFLDRRIGQLPRAEGEEDSVFDRRDERPFDITTKQPQLFVMRDFQHLADVLEEFASRMAFRVGGLEGINKAIECKNTATCEYSSGPASLRRFHRGADRRNDHADLSAHDRAQRARLRGQGTARARPRLSRGRFRRADRQLE